MLYSAGMDAGLSAEFWDEAWSSGRDSAAWSRMLEGLSADDAAWRPAPERHSIWQIVMHIVFWREVVLRRGTGVSTSDDEIRTRNWPLVEVSEAAWSGAKQQWQSSFKAFVAGIRDGKVEPRRSIQLLQHDQYHAGQIMYLRAMLGLKPIE